MLNVLAAPAPALFVLLGAVILLTVVAGIPVHAVLLSRRAGPAYQLRAFNRWYVYLAFFLVIGVWQQGAYRFLKANVAEPFRIPSPAGEPTLLVGDYIYAVKVPGSVRRPRRDSLVVYRSPEPPGIRVIKRVVGLPGDVVSMRDGWFSRNGHQLSEPYAKRHEAPIGSDDPYVSQMRSWQVLHLVGGDTARYRPTMREWGPLVVPPDSFFALGDNRDQSFDSRFYGFVPFESVSAKPHLIYFSFETGVGVRWARIGRRIH